MFERADSFQAIEPFHFGVQDDHGWFARRGDLQSLLAIRRLADNLELAGMLLQRGAHALAE